jgi:hypothetical protein
VSRALVLALLVLLAGCGAPNPGEPAPGEQWASCWHDDADCGPGLMCFSTFCSFRCGEIYTQLPDGTYIYGLNQPSVDSCTAIGGSCLTPPGSRINACTMPDGAASVVTIAKIEAVPAE